MLLNGLLLLSLLSIAVLSALIIDNNQQAEQEARLQMLRLIRSQNRNQIQAITFNVPARINRNVPVEASGFFVILSKQEDSSNVESISTQAA